MADVFEIGRGAQLSVAGRSIEFAELQALVDDVDIGGGRPLHLDGTDVLDTVTAVFAAARAGVAVILGSPELLAPSISGSPQPTLPADAFLVVRTSGTSGRPRLVVRTAESWLSSFRPLAEICRLDDNDVVLLTGPLTSTLHLFAAIHTLWLGAHLTDDPTIATAAHMVPTVLGDLLVDLPRHLRTAVVAGARLPGATESAALAHGLRLVEYYGAAELSFVAARVAPEPLTPFPGVKVRIVEGCLWARSPYLAIARLDPTAGGSETLRDDDGFVTVGDLATMDEQGCLSIRGRGDEAVTTGGHTVLVEDVESVISALPGVRQVAVVGVSHARLGEVLTAVVELTDGTELSVVRAAARTRLTGPSVPRRWEVVAHLPRLDGGKIARSVIRDRLGGR